LLLKSDIINTMSQIEFETEKYQPTSSPSLPSRKKKGLTYLVMKYSGGIIRNETQANLVLIGILIALVLIMFVTSTGNDTNVVTDPVIDAI